MKTGPGHAQSRAWEAPAPAGFAASLSARVRRHGPCILAHMHWYAADSTAFDHPAAPPGSAQPVSRSRFPAR